MSIILGSAVTGAKYTPRNHSANTHPTLDRICRGEGIPISKQAVALDAAGLHSLGCRYLHYHARNVRTREQTTDNMTYAAIGGRIRATYPDILLSFGASRNGAEVLQKIERFGEWERISQAALRIEEGGAHFVTVQAAVELQVICDLERKLGREIGLQDIETEAFVENARSYEASRSVENVTAKTGLRSHGSQYGSTSAATQIAVYARAVKARDEAGLLHEVEWVQLNRSYAMTRLAIERRDIRLGGNGHLNVTLLFGFSPKLRMPDDYAEFKSVVAVAKRLEYDAVTGRRVRKITVSVGASVIPRHAAYHIRPLDVGRFRGQKACALRRLAVWAGQPDSGVDILRSGMEDTPYEVDLEKGLIATTNTRLCEIAAVELNRNSVDVETDWATTRKRLGAVKTDCRDTQPC